MDFFDPQAYQDRQGHSPELIADSPVLDPNQYEEFQNKIALLIPTLDQKFVTEQWAIITQRDGETNLPIGETLANAITKHTIHKFCSGLPIITYRIPTFHPRMEYLYKYNYSNFMKSTFTQMSALKLNAVNWDNIMERKMVKHVHNAISEWLYLGDGNSYINKDLAPTLSDITLLELSLILYGFMPTELYNAMSKTPLAMICALYSGLVITPQVDPMHYNVNRFKQLCTFTKGIHINMLSLGWDRWNRFIGRYDDSIVGSYLRLAQPGQDALDAIAWNCYQYERFKVPPGKPLPPIILRLINDMGIEPKLYPVSEILKVLYTCIMVSAVYYMTKLTGIQRQPLPNDFNVGYNTPEEYDAITLMASYSDAEILDTYLPYFDSDPDSADYYPSRNRSEFLSTIVSRFNENVQRTLMWKFVVGKPPCSNDDMLDPVMQTSRGQSKQDTSDEDVLSNPYLSYGVFMKGGKRRCFAIDELITAFQDSGFGAMFLDPDWRPPLPGQEVTDVIDPVTGKPLEKTFPTTIMKDLRRDLRDQINKTQPNARGPVPSDQAKQAYRDLAQVMDDVFVSQDKTQEFLVQQKEFLSSKPGWRNDLLIYFSWVFLFGIWERFWKGPGNEYTVIWHEYDDISMEYKIRDEHVVMELDVRSMLIEALEKSDTELLKYIRQLPFFYRDWRTKVISLPTADAAIELLRTNLIEGVIDYVQLSDFCMAQSSDLLCGSAIVYLTKILDVPEDRINDLLLYVMSLLRSKEAVAIEAARAKLVTKLATEVADANVLEAAIVEHSVILNIQNVQQPPLRLNMALASGHLPEGLEQILGDEEDFDQRLGENGDEDGEFGGEGGFIEEPGPGEPILLDENGNPIIPPVNAEAAAAAAAARRARGRMTVDEMTQLQQANEVRLQELQGVEGEENEIERIRLRLDNERLAMQIERRGFDDINKQFDRIPNMTVDEAITFAVEQRLALDELNNILYPRYGADGNPPVMPLPEVRDRVNREAATRTTLMGKTEERLNDGERLLVNIRLNEQRLANTNAKLATETPGSLEYNVLMGKKISAESEISRDRETLTVMEAKYNIYTNIVEPLQFGATIRPTAEDRRTLRNARPGREGDAVDRILMRRANARAGRARDAL